MLVWSKYTFPTHWHGVGWNTFLYPEEVCVVVFMWCVWHAVLMCVFWYVWVWCVCVYGVSVGACVYVCEVCVSGVLVCVVRVSGVLVCVCVWCVCLMFVMCVCGVCVWCLWCVCVVFWCVCGILVCVCVCVPSTTDAHLPESNLMKMVGLVTMTSQWWSVVGLKSNEVYCSNSANLCINEISHPIGIIGHNTQSIGIIGHNTQ